MIEGAGRDKWHADGEGRSLGRQPPVADRAESWPTGRLRVGWPIYRSAETAWLATSCRASRSSRPQPNESCGAIHNRMPAVLAREVWPLWLGAQDAYPHAAAPAPRSTRSSLVAEHDAPLYGLLNSAIGWTSTCPYAKRFGFFGNAPGACERWPIRIRPRYLTSYE